MLKQYTIVIISIFLNVNIFGAVALKPCTDKDLADYGGHDSFNPTVQINGACSASRIKIPGKELPFDLYVSAAHCFEDEELESEDDSESVNEENDDKTECFFNILKNSLEFSVDNFDFETFLDLCYENGPQFAESDEFDKRQLIISFLDVIENTKFLLNQGFLNRLPTSLEEYEEALKKYESACVVNHERITIDRSEAVLQENKDGLDLAVFTTFEKTSKPTYPIRFEDNRSLSGSKATSVGYGMSMYEPMLPCRPRQAINTQMRDVTEDCAHDQDSLHCGMAKDFPMMLRSQEKFSKFNSSIQTPIGATTSGDSGGSLLIKDPSEGYVLVGVTSTGSAARLNRHFFKEGSLHENLDGTWVALDEEFLNSAIELLIKKQEKTLQTEL